MPAGASPAAAAASVPVPSPAQLSSPGFLSAVLGVRVAAVASERLSGGLANSLARLRLAYADADADAAAAAAPPAPRSLVAKTQAAAAASAAAADAPSPARNAALGLAREATFLASPLCARLRAALPAGALPAVLFAAGDAATGAKALLLEDVCEARGGVQAGLFFGPGSPLNWGAALPPPAAVEVARAAFLLAARWHGAFWGDAALLLADGGGAAALPWLRGGGGGRAEFDAAQAQAARSWAATEAMLAAAAAAGAEPAVAYAPRTLAAVRASLARVDWPAAAAARADAASRGAFTLIHGDWHPANLMRLPDGALVVLDFEVVGLGSGPQELAQFLISHMERRERAACEEALLADYLAELHRCARAGAVLPDAAALRAAYVSGGAERWVWLLCILGDMCPPKMTQYFADQLEAFLEDHGVTADTIGMPRV